MQQLIRLLSMFKKTFHFRATEMAQWLSVLVALPKDLGSIPSTHMVVHNYFFQVIQLL